MAQPDAYARAFDFSALAPADVPEVGARLDTELDILAVIIGQIRTSLAAIQRDDAALRNQAVHPDALSAATRALIVGGWELRGAWVTATAYALGDVVLESDIAYVCATAHTSGTFATDLAADKWVEFYTSEAVPSDGSVSVVKLAADTLLRLPSVTVSAFANNLLDDASASAARTTLGATATGDAIFTAASAAAARTTLGGTATGVALFTAASAAAARTTLGAPLASDVALLAGATFTGAVGFGDASHYQTLSGGNPVWVWDTQDFSGYNRSGNEFEIDIGGSQRFLLSTTRGRFAGNLEVAGAAGVSAVNLPHAAGYFTVSGAAVTGQRSFNVASITYVSTGVYDVAFTTAAANSTYVVLLTLQSGNNASAGVAWFTNLATTGFRIGVTDNNADSSFDPAGVSFVVIPGA